MKLNEERAEEPTEIAWVAEEVARVPLVTPTLPPATRTNTFVVGVDDGWLLVDIGPSSAEALDPLERFIEHELGGWGRVAGLVLTHEHADHVGGLCWFRDRTDAPVRARPETWRALDDDGEPLADASGELGADWRWLHTPGHAAGHVVLVRSDGEVLAADLVAGVGTIVVDPDEGDMADYLRSLRAVRALSPRRLHPAHGPSASDAVARLDRYIEHRLAREAKVLDAVPREGAPLREVTRRAYADIAPHLLPLAQRSALAHLKKLVADDKVERCSDGTYRSTG